MNMNYWIKTSFVTAILAFAVSCAPESSKLPDKPVMESMAEALVYSESGGQDEILFTTNRPWTAEVKYLVGAVSEGEEWCHISSLAGSEGENVIKVSVDALKGDYREAVVILNAHAAGYEVQIMQAGQPVIQTGDAVDITESSAALSGKWIYSGEISVQEFGIAVAASGESYRYVPVSSEDRQVSVVVSDLKAQTDYNYAVYVKTTDGTIYMGDIKEFKTDPAPVRKSIAEINAEGEAVSPGGKKSMKESLYIEGTVVYSADNLLIQDDSAAHSGLAVSVNGNYAKGDKLKIRTKGGELLHLSSGLVKLDVPSKNIERVSSGNVVSPVQVGHIELASFGSMAVSIANTQLTKLFTNSDKYPVWGSTTVWTFEVNGSDQSYCVYVPSSSALAKAETKNGSGSIEGVCYFDESLGEHVVLCSETAQLAGLTEERFESLLEFAFLETYFDGVLNAEEEADARIVVPYRNGDNSYIEGPVFVTMTSTNPDALGTLSVESFDGVQIGTGSGQIVFKVSGVPAAAGAIEFEIHGINGLRTNTCTAEIIGEVLPVVGNFEAVWDTNTSKGSNKTSGTSSNSAITITDLFLVASSDNISATKWADLGAQGWDLNTSANFLTSPEQYFYTEIIVGSGKTLSLSGFDLTQRINGGDITLSVQYSINGGEFAEIVSLLMTSDTADTVVNLGKVKALTSLPEGTKVTMRLVPMGTNTKTKWGIKAKSRFAIYGNAE